MIQLFKFMGFLRWIATPEPAPDFDPVTRDDANQQQDNISHKTILKVGSAILGLALIIALLLFAFIDRDTNYKLHITYTNSGKPEATFKVLHPYLVGTDQKEQVFKILADYGEQAVPNHMWLNKVSAEVNLLNDINFTLTADKGYMDIKTKLLKLDGEVHILSKKYEVNADEAQVDYQSKTISGHSGVVLRTQAYTLQSNTFHLSKAGAELHLTGGVIAKLN